MLYVIKHNKWQHNNYELNPKNKIEAIMNPITDHFKNLPIDTHTEILNELGTTDIAIGDATAEIMITTIGAIPNEMYYLEDTTSYNQISNHNALNMTNNHSNHTFKATPDKYISGFTAHSTIFISLIAAFIFLLLLCCITAFVITRSRKKCTYFRENDIECDKNCGGVNQPLLNR